jgi:hypothetical protein
MSDRREEDEDEAEAEADRIEGYDWEGAMDRIDMVRQLVETLRATGRDQELAEETTQAYNYGADQVHRLTATLEGIDETIASAERRLDDLVVDTSILDSAATLSRRVSDEALKKDGERRAGAKKQMPRNRKLVDMLRKTGDAERAAREASIQKRATEAGLKGARRLHTSTAIALINTIATVDRLGARVSAHLAARAAAEGGDAPAAPAPPATGGR